jgi:uncharacterized protein
MAEILLRNVIEPDLQPIVDLNASEVQYTSPMDLACLRSIDSLAAYHMVAAVDGCVAGFLIAIREQRPYHNENYRWFSSRYAEFLYIDRIVVDAKFSGLKIGTSLYKDIFNYARLNRIPVIACEYNVVPCNERSRSFHEKFGFREVGTQWLANGQKQVSLQIAEPLQAFATGAFTA